MHSPQPTSTLYLSAPDVIELVRRRGVESCLRGMADYLHADFLRWGAFDKSARVASHSRDGVIELEGKRHVTVPDYNVLLEEAGDDADGGFFG